MRSKLKRLEHLEVCGGAVTDAGVAHVAPLGHLTHLSLNENSRITDASVPVLAQLFELVYLNMSKSRLSSTGVQRLHPLAVSLSCLPEPGDHVWGRCTVRSRGETNGCGA